MPHAKVRMEWRKGELGNEGTFVFSPNPFLTRPTPGKRTAAHTIPLLDGVIIQELGFQERTVELRGVLFNKTNIWDDMEVQRNNLINGLLFGPGQLHLISLQRHLRYDAIIDTNGLRFDEQQFSNIQDYTVTLRIPGTQETIVTETTKTISSNTEVA